MMVAHVSAKLMCGVAHVPRLPGALHFNNKVQWLAREATFDNYVDTTVGIVYLAFTLDMFQIELWQPAKKIFDNVSGLALDVHCEGGFHQDVEYHIPVNIATSIFTKTAFSAVC